MASTERVLAERIGRLQPAQRRTALRALADKGLHFSSLPIVPVGSARCLSFAQERLWFLAQLEPGSAAYHMPAAFRLTGTLDEQALQRSFSRIVERHEVLRT